MSPQEIQLLFDYNSWANHRTLGAAEKLTPEQFTQPMGSSFTSVRDTLAHIYGAESVWLERFHGRSPSARSEEHTSELQSRVDLVCRLLLEKKKKKHIVHLDIKRRQYNSPVHSPVK